VQLSYIGDDLNNTATQTWVPNALSLVQAVLAPVISSASDTFQARKILLVGPSIISFIGAAIAPGSSNIYRLIVAQILIGFGFATVPLAYCVPSEILPRKWRPSEFIIEWASPGSLVTDVNALQWHRLG
jgi:MFS family permease